MLSDWHTKRAKQDTMSLMTKVAKIRSMKGVCYWTATMAITWATRKSHCAKCSFCWPWVYEIWIQTFTVSLRAIFQMYQIFRIFGVIEWEWIIKHVRWYFLPGKGYRGGRNSFRRGCYYWYMACSVLRALTTQHGILACGWLLKTFKCTN